MRIWCRAVFIAALPLGLGLVSGVTPAHAADPPAESAFVSRINSLRESKGLAPLQVDSELVGIARRWTDRMVDDGYISHNPDLANEVSQDWIKLGENVGVGSDVDSLMRAFINSPEHYRNLVDPDYGYVGVGVTYAPDGRMYTTHNFMALAERPAPAPKPVAQRAPPPEPEAAPLPPAPPPPPAAPQRVRAILIALRLADV